MRNRRWPLRYWVATCLLWLAGLGGAAGQTATGLAALDRLVVALDSGVVAPVRPFITPSTRVGGLPPAYTARVLAQLVPQFGPVEGLRVVRQEPAGSNTRYVCALTQRGAEQACDFVLTPAGQFAELNLAPPGSGPRRVALSPSDLTTPPSVDAALRLVHGLLLVEAEIDGRRGTFLLDSGAPTLVLNQREFAAPGTEAAPTGRGGVGVNGRLAGASYHATQQFNWQGISFQNKEVPTLDLSSLEGRLGGAPLLGIIGYNVFSQYALTLDYRGGLVQLRQPGTTPTGPAPLMRVPFELSGHLPVVTLAVAGQAFAVAVDCGAQTNLLDQQYEAALAPQLRQAAATRVSGADAASRPATSGELRTVRLVGGPLVFRHQQTVFADISHLNQPARAHLQGLVGYPLLSQYRTTIDYVNKELLFSAW